MHPSALLLVTVAALTGQIDVARPASSKPGSQTNRAAVKSDSGKVKDSRSDPKPPQAGSKSLPSVPVRSHSGRDPLPVAAEIDRIVGRYLAEAGVLASSRANDGEFLRRVTLDIAGRVPTHDETLAFLANEDRRKRERWIDALLDSSLYGNHFATIWRELTGPHETGKPRTGRDPFAEWLAEQFNQNRGWNEIVDDMLTAEGNLREYPQTGFIMANSEELEPRANLIADATARLFWGVQLRCAECHDHPFAPWKQTDFWGTAAFFSRLRKGRTDGKNPAGWTLTELAADETERQYLNDSPPVPHPPGPAIMLPTAAGKQSGAVIKARFLGGDEVEWHDDGPFRPRFSAWATGRDNPYFAANAVNRVWSHFFGRGLVNPLDEFHDDNPPSHPELLARLSAEFANSAHDVKHLIRCVCNSQTYQRTSRAEAGNEADAALFSHMAVRVIRPEVLYDSFSIVLYPPMAKGGQQGPLRVNRVNPIPHVSRDEFIRFFSSVVDENRGSVVNQGIPQFLRIMNGPLIDGEAPGVARFAATNMTTTQVIESLYLATYSRYPTSDERQRVAEYFEESRDPNAASAGFVWVLLNSSEFVLNH